MGNSYTIKKKIKEDIIIDDNNDILYDTYNKIRDIKYKMNYNEFITNKIYLLQIILNLFKSRVMDEIDNSTIYNKLVQINNIKQWNKFILSNKFDKIIRMNFKNLDLFILQNYKYYYENNNELINNVINSLYDWDESNKLADKY
jgi:hypothetical protein